MLDKISIIIPVRNEEERIQKTIEDLRKSASLVPTEIIVVDGQSSDRTREIAQSSADIVLSSPKPSRGLQMQLGAQASTGELLLFLHADTCLPENWQEIVTKTFDRNSAAPVAAAFNLAFDSARLPFKIIAWLSRIRTRFTGVPQGDQALAVKRSDYLTCGGFPEVPLMEEYFLLPKLRKLGEIRILKEPAVTSSRKYEKKGPLRNALMNSWFILMFYLGVSPQKLAEWYYS